MTSYFSHDSNARNDERILRLRQKYGARGYGIYFMLLERMRDEAEYKCTTDYETLSFDLRERKDIIKHVVEDFDLFDITSDGLFFTSHSFLLRMAEKDDISSKRREAVNKRWKNKHNQQDKKNEENTNVLQTEYNCNTFVSDLYIQEEIPSPHPSPISKEKESKENKNIPPTPQEGEIDEEDWISLFSTSRNEASERIPTVTRVNIITKTLLGAGIDKMNVDSLLRYSDLGIYGDLMHVQLNDKGAKELIQRYRESPTPEAPFAAIDAVREIGKLVPDVQDQEAIIDTFRAGTLAERKTNADKLNSLLASIALRRGTPKEVLNPGAFLRKSLNIQ